MLAQRNEKLDTYMLALLVLEPEEIEACFLAAFYKLPASQQILIEDVGLAIMSYAHLDRAEDALELPAKLGLHFQTGQRRVVVHHHQRTF